MSVCLRDSVDNEHGTRTVVAGIADSISIRVGLVWVVNMGTVVNNRLKAHVGVKDTRNVAEASANVEALVVLGRARVANVVVVRVDLVG